MSTLREAAQQALEALERLYNDTEIMVTQDQHRVMKWAIAALRAALAEPEGGGNLPPPLQKPTVAENATTQQRLEDTPPSDYRRGYWDGFNIGKREGRIEAEDALAEPVQEPVFNFKEPQPGMVNLDAFRAFHFNDPPKGGFVGEIEMLKWLVRNRDGDYWKAKYQNT